MAKKLQLRRGTTTQHGSFTGAEGELTIDTTKDTAVVHDGSTAGGRPLARQDMDNVPAGTILGTQLENSGVTAGQYGSSSAIPIVTVDAQGLVTAASTTAIDSTTIANGSSSVSVANNGAITSNANHDFSAGIDVTGEITGDKLTLEDDGSASPILNIKTDDQNPWGLRLGNDTYSTNDNHGMMSYLNNGGEGYFFIRGNGAYKDMHFSQNDGTANKIVIKLEADDQSAELYAGGSKKFETDSNGVTVTGNIAVSGTVDGRDLGSDGTYLDSLYGGSNGVIDDDVTVQSTVAQSDNSNKIATTAYVRTAIANADAFPSGTKMLFQQTSAPTGWTKITSSVDNKALRLVSGSVGSGGNATFTAAFSSYTPAGNVGTSGNSTASFSGSVSGNTGNSGGSATSSVATGGSVNNHTLSNNQMPSHSHSTSFSRHNNYYSTDRPQWTDSGAGSRNFGTNNSGGSGSHSHGFTGGSHSHNISDHVHSFSGNISGNTGNHTHSGGSFTGTARDFAVQYVDVIVCSKD